MFSILHHDRLNMIDVHTFENKTAAYYTLGCKLNFAETSTLGKILEENGIRKVRSGEKADICVVNTCSVTELADKKCRQTIRKIARQHPGAFIVVTGCYAQLKPEEISHIPDVDLILGAEQKLDILQYLGDLQKKQKGNIVTTPTKDIKKFSPSCSRGDRTRYFLKVQDGCDYFCTYCTIPFARGRSRSGTIEQLTEQAREVALSGGKEIVITGVNIGDFGKQTGETFLDLIESLDQIEGIEHYRISSIEPNLLTDDIISFVARSKRFAPHFHIPLQSGSDTVLKLMHRHYDTNLFARKIETRCIHRRRSHYRCTGRNRRTVRGKPSFRRKPRHFTTTRVYLLRKTRNASVENQSGRSRPRKTRALPSHARNLREEIARLLL